MAALDVLDATEAAKAVGGSGGRWEEHLPALVTAASKRLDRLIGPIVQRTVTGEAHDGGDHDVYLARWPILSVATVTEYDDTAPTVLAAETNASKTDDDYLLDPYEIDPDHPEWYGNRLRRRSNGVDACFVDGRSNVVVTYTAGRFTATDQVDEFYKEGARLLLQNVLRSRQPNVAALAGGVTDDNRRLPGFEIPNIVLEHFAGMIQQGPSGLPSIA